MCLRADKNIPPVCLRCGRAVKAWKFAHYLEHEVEINLSTGFGLLHAAFSSICAPANRSYPASAFEAPFRRLLKNPLPAIDVKNVVSKTVSSGGVLAMDARERRAARRQWEELRS